MEPEETEYKMLMAFLDGSESFANGFAIGAMWEQLKQGPAEWENNVAISNQDQALMVASKMGYRVVEIRKDCPHWTYLKLALV